MIGARPSAEGPWSSLPEIRLAATVDLAGGRLAEWEAIGSGEPLLWIEGGPGFPAHLGRPDVVLLADRFRGHLVNAPGSGRTSVPADPEGYSLPGHVAFFDEVRRALGLGPVTVMGHSWGGLVAAALAALVPEAVTRLIVIDGYAGGGSVDPAAAKAERERALDRLRDRPWFAAALASDVDVGPLTVGSEEDLVRGWDPCWPLIFAEPDHEPALGHVARIRRELRAHLPVLAAWATRFEADDHRPLLATVTCPTLVLVGEHDYICGPVWAREIAGAIPGSRCVEIPGAGHVPQYEAPAVLRATIDDWLAATAAR
jgi:pimeloyl-ACP methyl ester carboxylesterase